MIKNTIPFSWRPSNWKLEGKHRQRAWAHYYLSGEELANELLNIEYENKESNEYKIAALELSLKYNKLTQDEFSKQKANLENSAYFKVIRGEYNETGPGQGTMMFELDWNDTFVKNLKNDGWIGETDDFIVNAWFEDSCKQMLNSDEYDTARPLVTAYNRTRRRSSDDNTAEYS